MFDTSEFDTCQGTDLFEREFQKEILRLERLTNQGRVVAGDDLGAL